MFDKNLFELSTGAIHEVRDALKHVAEETTNECEAIKMRLEAVEFRGEAANLKGEVVTFFQEVREEMQRRFDVIESKVADLERRPIHVPVPQGDSNPEVKALSTVTGNFPPQSAPASGMSAGNGTDSRI